MGFGGAVGSIVSQAGRGPSTGWVSIRLGEKETFAALKRGRCPAAKS